MNTSVSDNIPPSADRIYIAEPYSDDLDDQPYGQRSNANLLNFGAIRAILWRQRGVLIGVVALAVILGVVLTMLISPIYSATSSLRVDPRGGEIIEGQEVVDPYIGSADVDRYMNTLRYEVESRSMAARVFDGLEAADREHLVGKIYPDGQPTEIGDEAWDDTQRNSAIEFLQSGLTAETPLEANVLNIKFTSTDAGLAAAVANGYAQGFLSNDVARALEANSYALQYLEAQIDDVRAELQSAERDAIEYARQNRIVGQPLDSAAQEMDRVGAGAPQTLSASNLSGANRTYQEARTARIEAEQRWRTVAPVPPAQLPSVQQNTQVQELQSRLSQLEALKADLLLRYQPDYPEVREAQAQIDSLSLRVASIGTEIKQAVRNEFEVAARQEQALFEELSRISEETLDEQDRRVQYNLIDREVGALRTQLASLMARYNQISSAANLQTSNTTLLDEAEVAQQPDSPNLIQNVFIALILGVGIAVLLALLREVLDDRIRSDDDVQRVLDVQPLGHVPYSNDADIQDALLNNFSNVSEAYASIRAALDFRFAKKQHVILQVTSSQASEGKTTTATALAQKYANLGKRTLLVDCDLRRPSVDKLFTDVRPGKGLIDILLGEATIKDVRLPNELDNFDVVPIATLPERPVEILSSGLMAEFLAECRLNYDIIILDSSPVMGIADAPLLSRFADAVLFVIEANRAYNGQARAAMRRLRDMDANVIGAVLTKFRVLEAGGDYSYAYNYYAYDQKKS